MKQHYADPLVESLVSSRPWLRQCGAVDLEPAIAAVFDCLQQTACRIVVLGDYNRGKSTLLNCLLGGQLLPADVVPLTGTAIQICFGQTLTTSILFADGTRRQDFGTTLLGTFGVLAEDHKMRTDVEEIKVLAPAPFLKGEIELVDLPGTNDKPEQEEFIQLQLLKADLVIFVLDATQPWTLADKARTQEWLLRRGINHVVYVVNYMNLLAEDDQLRIWQYVQDQVGQSHCQVSLPLASTYRIDALPALRAVIKGDKLSDGLLNFRADLTSWISSHAKDLVTRRRDRLKWVSNEVRSRMNSECERLRKRLKNAQEKVAAAQESYASAMALKQQIETEAASLSAKCVELPKNYVLAAEAALREDNYATWGRQTLLPEFSPLVARLHILCSKIQNGDGNIVSPSLSIPTEAVLNLPSRPPDPKTGSAAVAGAVIGGLITTLFGAPGAGAPFGAGLAAASAKRKWEAAMKDYRCKCELAYASAVYNNLRAFTKAIDGQITTARQLAARIIAVPPDTGAVTTIERDLRTLSTLMQDLSCDNPAIVLHE